LLHPLSPQGYGRTGCFRPGNGWGYLRCESRGGGTYCRGEFARRADIPRMMTRMALLTTAPQSRSAARGASAAAEGGYSTLAQMNTVELCLPVIGLLLGPVLIYKDFPSMLN
jgi:hypothetical protein